MNPYGIPEVFESEAKGQVKEVYEDIKYVLKVPVVNFIFRTLANYPDFLVEAWKQVRPSMLTTNMEEAARYLRTPAINGRIPTIGWDPAYSQTTLQQIHQTLFIFYYVNPKLLLIASAWTESLSNRPITGEKKVNGFIPPGVLNGLKPVKLVHISNAPTIMKQLLKDIAKTHRAFDVASDFRALAQYPLFLEKTWGELKPYVQTYEYDLLKAQLSTQSMSMVHNNMPYPVTINSSDLSRIYSPAETAGIIGLVSLFQSFLPALIVDGEFMRRTLAAQ
ncbi:halocarboxylic acid dehydrogenase DehI family protein [Halobacillus amylolyticus]|uniref:Halocarboxylic acid dehydrogenase DehI family protein n=1 Tax=Halobacillus amylolyticus TaxID=2932259 RepID=A0ABY4H6Q9_9BACI|nr:halocarboxylic acid dehydrogenase DehI family protein [Halobacillus amylolyticus]UOR10394.1 halocarboxylic acid dehydrogenase DehI family protein [Halobacillus amylolyticus]